MSLICWWEEGGVNGGEIGGSPHLLCIIYGHIMANSAQRVNSF